MADISDKIKLLVERTNLRTIISALSIFLVGAALLFASSLKDFWKENNPWQSLTQDLGGLMVASVAIGIVLDLWTKRAFVDELTTKIGLATNIKNAGIVDYQRSYNDVKWETLFSKTKTLRVFFTYGRTWRNRHLARLLELAEKNNANIEFILPDPDIPSVITSLAQRFGDSSRAVHNKIVESTKEFKKIKDDARGANVSITYAPFAPLFAVYQFDHTIVLTLYSHIKERQDVPTILIEEGQLYDFTCQDLESLIKLGRTAT